MICPECGSEYIDGITRCTDCNVDLIEAPPGDPEVDLVSVFASSNPAILPIVESVLRDSGIEFLTTGNIVQVLQGAVGSPYAVPVEFWVRDDQEEAAREILAGIENAPVADE